MKINGDGRPYPFFLKICYIVMLALWFNAGCGKDAVKPSEDSILAQGALRSLERMREAYEAKDLDALKALAEPALILGPDERLDFDTVSLSFSTPRIIKITGDHVTVSVNWQGEWEQNGVTKKDRGSGSFIFQKDSMRLIQVDGDNPFAGAAGTTY